MFASLVLLPLLLWGGTSSGPGGLAAGIRPSAISGGERVGECGWPSVVWMNGCTGTLIDPQHVVFAAHCNPTDRVFFGEDAGGIDGVWEPVERCWSFPGGKPGDGTDFGICRLEVPRTDIAIVPPLLGCETEILAPGQSVTVVGFGLTTQGDFGIKHQVTTTINELTDNNEVGIGGDGKDSCQGDSGGPAFVELPDGAGWRVFGITSYGSSDCQSGGFYSLVHNGMPWFEDASGRDLSPCHDAEGSWDAGPRCGAAPLAAQTGVGSWPACRGGPRTGSITTCGPPFDAAPDDHAPTVAIAEPTAGEEFATKAATGTTPIAVFVDAEDVGWGLEWVELQVDGNAMPGADFAAPFEFELDLGPGVHDLTAVAFDFAGNVTHSEVVRIGIDETPSAVPGADQEEDASCSCSSSAPHTWPLACLVVLLAGIRPRRWPSG